MIKLKGSLVLVFLLVAAFMQKLPAQKLYFDHLTVEDGLQNNIVFAVTQDSSGFMWFATMTGIDRFDGTQIVHYKLPSGKNTYKEFIQVPFIHVDERNRLWAASASTLFCYNGKLDRFDNIDSVTGKVAALQANITALVTDHAGRIWLGLNKGLLVYDPVTGAIFSLDNIRAAVRTIFEDDDGTIWVGTNKGLSWLHFNGKEIVNVKHDDTGLYDVVKSTQVLSVSKDGAGRYWLYAMNKGIYVYTKGQPKPEAVQLPGFSAEEYAVKDIFHDRQTARTYLAVDGAGLFILDHNLQPVSLYETNEDDPSSLSNNGTYDIFRDKYNRLWVTTFGGGVNLARSPVQPFVNFFHEVNNHNSLGNNMAKAITLDKRGRCWFGTRRGISVYNPATQSWQHINKSVHNSVYTTDNILSLTCDKAGTVWAGTYGGGLVQNKASGEARVFVKNDQDSNSIGTDHIFSVYADSRNRVWCGGIRGPLSVLDIASGKFTRITLGTSIINCITGTAGGQVIVGAEKGIFTIDPVTFDANLITRSKDHAAVTKVSCLLEYRPGLLWAGTQENGLVIFDLEQGVKKVFTTADGLPSDIICGLVKEANGDVWISTSKGIAHYQPRQNSFTTYTKADGLGGTQFNTGAFYQAASGDLIFGSTNGFSLFNPRNIKASGYKPHICFTDLFVNNRQVVPGADDGLLPQSVNEMQAIELGYRQNSFSVKFVSPTPAPSGKHLYSWKLEGFDKIWSPPSTIPTAVYTNLNSGRYTLLVKAFSKGSLTEVSGTRRLDIIITVPWWRSGWAYFIYSLLAGVVIYAVYIYYTNRNARKKYAERLELHSNIAHEIRTPLTLIKGPVNALAAIESLEQGDRNNLELAKKNIEKLESLIAQFIDYHKSGINKMQMRVSRTDIVALLNEIIRSFRPLMEEKGIRLTHKLSLPALVILCDKEKLEKVLNNLLSNAAKYTPAGKTVAVTLYTDVKELVIDVADTGIGIPESQQPYILKGYYRAENTVNLKETGSGIGLSLAKNLLELHKGKLSFKSIPGAGSTFTVRLPLKNDALEAYLIPAAAVQSPVPVPENVPVATGNGSMPVYRVLIAEDNDDLRDFLAKEITRLGHKVFQSANGEDALRFAGKQAVDLVITDLMMPKMNGFQLCTFLKKDMRTCHIPVIILTALHDKDYVIEGFKAGADDYVKKPFDIDYIAVRIDNLLQDRVRFKTKMLRVFEQPETENSDDPDVQLLKQVTELTLANMADPDFSVEKMSRLMAMSRPVLFRKFKSLTGQSLQSYIATVRLKRAVELLHQRKYTIGEIAFMVGFEDPKYFSTAFKKHYGKTPSEFLQTAEPDAIA